MQEISGQIHFATETEKAADRPPLLFSNKADRLSPISRSEQLQHRPGRWFRRGGVLAGDQVAGADDMCLPVRPLAILASGLAQFILHQERHDLGQTNRGFLGIGKTGDPFPLYQRRTVSTPGMAQYPGGMADCGDRFQRTITTLSFIQAAMVRCGTWPKIQIPSP